MTFLIGFLDATSEIFFMVSPLAVVQVDSFNKFVLDFFSPFILTGGSL